MTSQPGSPAPAGDNEVVDLSVPADPAYLSVMRTATAGLGTHLNLTLDEIEDLQIAVDEACALLIGSDEGRDLADRSLNTSFTVHRGVLTVRIDGPAAALPSDENFAWTMLHALSGEVSTGTTAGGTWIVLTCRGRGVAA